MNHSAHLACSPRPPCRSGIPTRSLRGAPSSVSHRRTATGPIHTAYHPRVRRAATSRDAFLRGKRLKHAYRNHNPAFGIGRVESLAPTSNLGTNKPLRCSGRRGFSARLTTASSPPANGDHLVRRRMTLRSTRTTRSSSGRTPSWSMAPTWGQFCGSPAGALTMRHSNQATDSRALRESTTAVNPRG